MTAVIEFCQIGTHGIDDGTYPWKRWMNGMVWGYCPEEFGGTPKRFRRTLHEAAKKNDKQVKDINEHKIAGQMWVLFRFVTPC